MDEDEARCPRCQGFLLPAELIAIRCINCGFYEFYFPRFDPTAPDTHPRLKGRPIAPLRKRHEPRD